MILPITPSFRLDGKRALVTGAGGGIGAALAVALAAQGAAVTLIARRWDGIAETAQALRDRGDTAVAEMLDVTSFSKVQQFFEERPAFDILVNNAGTNRPKPMQDVLEHDYDAVMDLNVKAAFFVAQAAVRRLLAEGKPGSLIHIGSQMGHVGGPNRSLYCASKWALEGMSKAFALDLAAVGIRSNTIAPTFIETPMTLPFLADAAFRASVVAKIKLGRIGQVEDLMGAVVYLASDASALVTGTSIIVDGGWTAE